MCTRSNHRQQTNANELRPKIQSLITSFTTGNVNDNDFVGGSGQGNNYANAPRVGKINHNLVDISFLPIYYNNVRGVTSKHNMSTKIELSMYKVLVLTETWLSKREVSCGVRGCRNQIKSDPADHLCSLHASVRSGGGYEACG